MKFEKIIVYAFFLILFFVGLSTFRHYGLSNDELSAHDLGTFNYYYITENNNTLLRYSDKDYPPAFETLIICIEKTLGLSPNNTEQIFYLRHFLIFLTFYVGVIFFYLLCKTSFNSRLLGLLGCLMLVFCPRIYGHAFFNSKDIPFMSFMIMSAYSGLQFLKSPTLIKAFVHAFFCALSIDTRIGGILMPAITLVIYGLQTLTFAQQRFGKFFSIVIGYLIFLFLLVVLMWPMLWQHPFKNFILFFQSAAHFRYPYEVFYMGQWLNLVNHELPWHYLPTWIFSTVPMMILVLFMIGTGSFLFSFKKGLKAILEKPTMLLAMFWFWIPLMGVMLLKPTIYDGWRHFYFLYPALVLLAIYGFRCIVPYKKVSFILLSLLIMGMSLTLVKMIKTHPHEHIYFNRLAGLNLKHNLNKFQLDSWGVEFRKPLEFILTKDPGTNIMVFTSNVFAPINLFLIPEHQRRKIQFVRDPKIADYWILDYYFMNANPNILLPSFKIFELNIEGVDIVSVYEAR